MAAFFFVDSFAAKLRIIGCLSGPLPRPKTDTYVYVVHIIHVCKKVSATYTYLDWKIAGYTHALQRERGQCAVYCTSPQSFIITFSNSLAYQLWGLQWNLIGWFINLSVQTFQPLISIYSMGNFVYSHWGCTSNY